MDDYDDHPAHAHSSKRGDQSKITYAPKMRFTLQCVRMEQSPAKLQPLIKDFCTDQA